LANQLHGRLAPLADECPPLRKLINSIADSGKLVLKVSGSAMLQYPAGGALRKSIETHGAVETLASVGDGRRVVSGSGDGRIKVWDIDLGKCLQTLSRQTGETRTISMHDDAALTSQGGKRFVSHSPIVRKDFQAQADGQSVKGRKTAAPEPNRPFASGVPSGLDAIEVDHILSQHVDFHLVHIKRDLRIQRSISVEGNNKMFVVASAGGGIGIFQKL